MSKEQNYRNLPDIIKRNIKDMYDKKIMTKNQIAFKFNIPITRLRELLNE